MESKLGVRNQASRRKVDRRQRRRSRQSASAVRIALSALCVLRCGAVCGKGEKESKQTWENLAEPTNDLQVQSAQAFGIWVHVGVDVGNEAPIDSPAAKRTPLRDLFEELVGLRRGRE